MGVIRSQCADRVGHCEITLKENEEQRCFHALVESDFMDFNGK